MEGSAKAAWQVMAAASERGFVNPVFPTDQYVQVSNGWDGPELRKQIS